MSELVEIIKLHIAYRFQILKLAKSDLVKTYSGASLGWAWAIIKPAMTIFVYWFTFAIGLRVSRDVNGYSYFLWLIASIIPWFYMGEMLVEGANCLRKYSYLVTKTKFPVSTIPTFVSISKLIVHIALLLILIIIFALYGYGNNIYLLQLPFYILLSFLLFTLWGLFSCFIAAISKDFLNLIKSSTVAILWLSGIIWDPSTLSIIWIKKLLYFNPITFLINGYRNCFINHTWFFEQPKQLLCFGITLLIMLVLALYSYRKFKKEVPDVL